MRKAEGYHAVHEHYVAVSCCLSATQVATSKKSKVPINVGQFFFYSAAATYGCMRGAGGAATAAYFGATL